MKTLKYANGIALLSGNKQGLEEIPNTVEQVFGSHGIKIIKNKNTLRVKKQ